MNSTNLRTRLDPEVVRIFTQQAAAARPSIQGLADFDWHEWDGIERTVRLMDGEIIPGQAAWRDVVHGEYGIFYYGWIESCEIALWKWVPAWHTKKPRESRFYS